MIDPARLTPAERGRQREENRRIINRMRRARMIQHAFFWYTDMQWLPDPEWERFKSGNRLKPARPMRHVSNITPEAKH